MLVNLMLVSHNWGPSYEWITQFTLLLTSHITPIINRFTLKLATYL